MSKENNNSMKAVTLSFEKYGCLINLPTEEAGEIIQTVLAYGMTGNMPEIKERYKAMYYNTFLEPITAQIAAADKRAKQCREAAEARSAAIKEAKKIVAKQAREEKSVKKNESIVDGSSSEVSNIQTAIEGSAPVITSSNVSVDSVEYSMAPEDLSFDRLISLGVRRDTGSFNTELTWSNMSDDDKRAAIAYASQNFKGSTRLFNSQYASQFLKSKVWKNG